MLTNRLIEKLQSMALKPHNISFSGLDPAVLFEMPCVAIIGSRKPTPYGKDLTEQLATDLSRAGVVIISGLAFGVDGLAHRAALKAGGPTVAVLPSGLEAIYPASHQMLASDIRKTGLLMSEYPPKHRPRKHDFLNRNRIIAALSDAVIISEAAERSGSLNTARHAQALGIPVYAVPGRVNDPMSQGTNRLIARGQARLLTTADEILDLLHITKTKALHNTQTSLTEPAYRLLELIQQGTAEMSLLQFTTQLPMNELLGILTKLELDGLIGQDSLGNWTAN